MLVVRERVNFTFMMYVYSFIYAATESALFPQDKQYMKTETIKFKIQYKYIEKCIQFILII